MRIRLIAPFIDFFFFLSLSSLLTLTGLCFRSLFFSQSLNRKTATTSVTTQKWCWVKLHLNTTRILLMHRCFLKFLHGHQGGRGSQETHAVPPRGSEPVSISIHDPHEWQQITAHTHRDTRTGMVRSPTLTHTTAVAFPDFLIVSAVTPPEVFQNHSAIWRGMQFRAACFTGLENLRRKTVHLFKVTANRNDLRYYSVF